MIANYHTHTYRCGHASGEEREYIEKAIELGFKELGFSEHAPMPFPDDIPEDNHRRLLSMRMKTHETEGYVNSLLSLREEYKNDIKIHIGFEVEYFESIFNGFLEHIKPYPIDYFILGQHFGTPYNPEKMVHNGAQTGNEMLLVNYVDEIEKALSTGLFAYVAHPDLMFYRGSLEIYEREMTRLIKCANEHKIPLEFNLYGMQEVRNYPTFAFWQLASEIGCEVIIGSDAHKPENLLNPYAYKYATRFIEANPNLKLIERLDIKRLEL